RAIIDATKDLCVAYKPNLAFYESLGTAGWQALEKTVDYLPDNVFTIADAKRGDIGNTARMYARTFFETYRFDSVTVAPYMGRDSVEPFLEHAGKWAIVLGVTSNAGAADFQLHALQQGGDLLFEHVLSTVASWGTPDSLMFVAGATRADLLQKVRDRVPDHFLLVPGVGAQGGSLSEVARFMNADCGLLVNASRSIIYASNGPDFAEAARASALALQQEMAELLSAAGFA
ncbi:MAG: orotidine-5'-phosphate decarboxylase, partial [Bacteroidota bacterium]